MRTKHASILAALTLLACGATAENLNHTKGIFTLKSGEYEIDVSKVCNYTIAEIRWAGYKVVPLTGYNGTVMTYPPNGLVGCGHTEGGKIEEVKTFEISADGAAFVPEEGRSYTASRFILKKVTQLGGLSLTGEIECSANEIKITRSVEATAEQEITNLYLYMFCFSSKFKEWTACLPNGATIGQNFTDNDAFVMREDVKWAALFDPAAGKGAGVVYPEPVKGKGQKNTFWDKSNYHKFYLFLDVPSKVDKGFSVPRTTIILRTFSATTENWKETARKVFEQ